jgi:hypothetical protein
MTTPVWVRRGYGAGQRMAVGCDRTRRVRLIDPNPQEEDWPAEKPSGAKVMEHQSRSLRDGVVGSL